MKHFFFTAVLASAFLCACDNSQDRISLGSGNAGGVYYKFANEYAQTINANNNGLNIVVKATAGTKGNMRLLKQGFVDIAIVQGDILKDALFGNGEYYNNKIGTNFAAIGALHAEAVQIVVSEKSGITSIQELIGKRVSIGEEESGVIRNAKIILDAYGISFEDIKIENLGFNESATALKNGKIDAFFCTAGIPTPAISELSKTNAIKILSIDSTDLKRIERQHSEFTAMEIPEGTYNNQEQGINTIGMKAILIANLDVEKATAYKLASSIFEFQGHPALDFATTSVPAKFHEGAAEFYASKGITVATAKKQSFKTSNISTGD